MFSLREMESEQVVQKEVGPLSQEKEGGVCLGHCRGSWKRLRERHLSQLRAGDLGR